MKQSVTLAPQHEHLVWGKLKEQVPLSVGSTVLIEPTSSKAAPRNVMVACTVCPLWGDKWIPLKVINLLNHSIVFRRNAKLADVHTCAALEDLELSATTSTCSSNVQTLQTIPDTEPENASAKPQYIKTLETTGLS